MREAQLGITKATKIPEIQAILPTNDTTNPTFKLIKIPAGFPAPFGCHVVHSPITDQSTADLLTHLSASSGDFWFTHIQTWSMDLQQKIMNLDAAKPFFPSLHKDQSWTASSTSLLMGVLEDDKELFKLKVDVLLTACTDAHKRNTSEQVPVNLTSKHCKGDNFLTMTDDLTTNRPTPTTSLTPPAKQPSQTINRQARFYILFAAYNSTTKTISPPNLTETALKLSALDGAQRRITFLFRSFATLLDQVANQWDYVSWNISWPHNMVLVFKGLLAEGQLNFQTITRVEDGKRWNVLALIPPYLSPSHATFLIMNREAELLLGECKEKLTKVDTAVWVKTNIYYPPQDAPSAQI